MEQVKIQVLGEDGKYRGGLFKDGPWHEHRWSGEPKANLQESMVCLGAGLDSGEWFLIQYVLPRQIVGDAACDSLFDEASSCCRRTAVQALHWFSQQAFGPPAALVSRVQAFVAEWPTFCASASARQLLSSIVEGQSVTEGSLLDGLQRDDLALLRRLGLVFPSGSGGEEHYYALSLVRETSVEDFIAWTNMHLARVLWFIKEHVASWDARNMHTRTGDFGALGAPRRNTETMTSAFGGETVLPDVRFNSPMMDLIDQLGALIDKAFRMAKFAGRWSDDWHCEGGRSPMQDAAMKRLRDRSSAAAEAVRAAVDVLIVAEQAVTDAKEATDEDYNARCVERDARRKEVEAAGEAAPATSAKMLVDAMAALEIEERAMLPAGGASSVAKPRASFRVEAISTAARLPIARAETDLAAERLREQGSELRGLLEAVAAEVESLRYELARLAPDGGRKLGQWVGASWSDALIALVRDLLIAAAKRDESMLLAALNELQREQLLVDLRIELAKVTSVAHPVDRHHSKDEAVGDAWGANQRSVKAWRAAAPAVLGFVERSWAGALRFGRPVPDDIVELNQRWRAEVGGRGGVYLLTRATRDLRDLALIDAGPAGQLLDLLQALQMPRQDALAMAIEAVRVLIDRPHLITASGVPVPATPADSAPTSIDPVPVGAQLGTGGPAKTFVAVCLAIHAKEGTDTSLAAGDVVMLDDVKGHLNDQDHKKAADYLAPSGRLVVGGWIERDGERVVLTAKGATEGMKRLKGRSSPQRT